MSDNPFLSGDQGQSTDQPAAPFMPAIPVYDGTTDGLTATMAALTDAVNRLTGNGPPPNNSRGNVSLFKTKQDPNTKKKQDKGKLGRFIEVSRTKTPTTVTDPNSGASVTFNQITQLKFRDNVTGETWEWNQ